jgi:FKBP-type peptidyl-prolyl cis-trans isomerase SlyD
MLIDEKSYVAIDYRLTLASGEEIDSSPAGQPFGFITGAGQVIPGLEKGLMGKTAGDQAKIVIEPEDGYGPVNEDLFQDIPRSQFPDDCKVEAGMTFQAQGPHGPIMLTVKDVSDLDSVRVDLNHPLAGQQLHFDVTVMEVREPSAEELAAVEQQSAGCACGTADPSNCGSGCNCG